MYAGFGFALSGDRVHGRGGTLKRLSMHSSKGLEFPLVMIPGVGQLPIPQFEPAEDARLLYVAMTRALDRLILLCSQPSNYSQRLASAIAQTKDALVGVGGGRAWAPAALIVQCICRLPVCGRALARSCV